MTITQSERRPTRWIVQTGDASAHIRLKVFHDVAAVQARVAIEGTASR